MTAENCVFCSPDELEWRTIRHDDHSRSFVSNPRFRDGQALVIPNRHITTAGELTDEEGASIMRELGRLGILLDRGFGSGIMQKYQPLQVENGIKVSHLHFHVFPRFEQEDGLFPVPEPNDFAGFERIGDEETRRLAERLR